MTQLLIQTTAPDYATWNSAFDAEGENIAATRSRKAMTPRSRRVRYSAPSDGAL